MSIKDLTITDQNVQSTYVQSQPDRLTGTAQQNKAVFDAFPQLIRQRFNALLEALAGAGAAGEIPIGPIEGVTAENVQQALAAIQQNLTAYINKIKSAVGASEVGVSPISGLEADNVQVALQALRTIQSAVNQNVQTIMSEKGAAAVGVSTISGMQAQNVQKALEELRKAIDDSVSGIIPGGSITADMIVDGAIVQLGALLAVAAAAAYDPEGSYAVGDYCTHGGKLHKCGTAIPDGEAWTAEHWTGTTVAAELAEVRASLSNKQNALSFGVADADVDVNTLTEIGTVAVPGSATNLPPDITSANWGLLTVSANTENGQSGCTQHLSITVSEGYFPQVYERNFNGINWSKWARIATATPPQEGNIPVVDGIREIGQCMYFQQQDGTTHFFVVAGAGSDGAQISNNQNFAVAPIGARPKAQYYYPAVAVSGGNTLNGYVSVNPDGTIVWVGNAVPYPGYIVSFGTFAIEKEG